MNTSRPVSLPGLRAPGLLAAACALALASCGGGDTSSTAASAVNGATPAHASTSSSSSPFAQAAGIDDAAKKCLPDAVDKVKWPHDTLKHRAPLVVAHRGFSGMHPEETARAYEAAADAQADSLEGDMHLTKDCKLVLRHNPWLSDNTTIAEVAKTNPEVMARKRTTPGRLVDVGYDAKKFGGPAKLLVDLVDPQDPRSVLKALVVDGEDHTNDWSISDFTLAEAKQWIKGTTYDNRSERPADENGLFPVITVQELLDIARAKGREQGREISIYPEVKNPYWNNQQAIANGCDTKGTQHPFEDAVLEFLKQNDLNRKNAPILIQSFDPASLKYLVKAGMKAFTVQLIDGNDVDYRTGDMIYMQPDEWNFISGRPYSWTLAGDPRYFDAMQTPEGLKEIAKYADAIGPWKPEVMRWKIEPMPTTNPDGTPFKPSLAAVNSVTPTPLIRDAHAAGLAVHAYTFRNEKGRLPGKYNGDPVKEYLDMFEAGLDGVFSDFTPTAVEARAVSYWIGIEGKR